MSDILSIGASGVRAYQSALTTVSENIANVGVEGYSRRTAALREVRGAGGAVELRPNGMGVRVAGVDRAADETMQAALRSAGADLSRTKAGVQWLDRIENALTGDRLAERVTGFFAAARSLAAEPGSTALRAGMLGAATSAAAAFGATGRALDRAAADLDTAAGQSVTELNALGATLRTVNLGLGRVQPGTAAAAELMDQRDRVLQQMSDQVDMSAGFDRLGRATVRLGGGSGPVFVTADRAGSVSYARSGAAVTLSVNLGGADFGLSPTGGALAGIVEGAQRIDAANTSLNGIATTFADAINTFQAQGEDLDGNPGQPIFAVGGRPTDLSVVLDDPRGIAASSTGGGTRDGSNLEALEAARTAGGFERDATAMVTENAAVLQQRNVVADAQTAIREGAVTALSTRTGVDLDNEAVELMRFQQAYQASSRVIQVAREAFQSILEIR